MSSNATGLEAEITRLIRDFLSRRIDAPSFEKSYAELWRRGRDSNAFANSTARTRNCLDRIFTALDAYCSDETLRQANDLDDQVLMLEVEKIFAEMASAKS